MPRRKRTMATGKRNSIKSGNRLFSLEYIFDIGIMQYNINMVLKKDCSFDSFKHDDKSFVFEVFP